jgi:hypothetical protein
MATVRVMVFQHYFSFIVVGQFYCETRPRTAETKPLSVVCTFEQWSFVTKYSTELLLSYIYTYIRVVNKCPCYDTNNIIPFILQYFHLKQIYSHMLSVPWKWYMRMRNPDYFYHHGENGYPYHTKTTISHCFHFNLKGWLVWFLSKFIEYLN